MDALRCDSGDYMLPIISQGANSINQLRTGKALTQARPAPPSPDLPRDPPTGPRPPTTSRDLTQASAQGCKVEVVETALASQKVPRRRSPRPPPPCPTPGP